MYRKFSDQRVCFLHLESPGSEESDKERLIRPVWSYFTSFCKHKIKTRDHLH